MRLAYLFLAILCAGWHASSWAECKTTVGLPAVINYGSIAVSNSLAVGAVIPATERPVRIVGTCTSANLFNQPVVACPTGPSAVAGMTGVYTTGLAGVGMRLVDINGVPMVGTGQCSTTSFLGTTDSAGHFDVSGTFALIKTGPITPGTLGAASYNTGIFQKSVTLNDNNNTISALSTTPIKAVACSVMTGTANQTVTLPIMTTHSLSSPGQTSGTTPFQIRMSCVEGVAVSVSFESVSGESGVASVLGSTGSASGIGIQLLDSTRAALVLKQPLVITHSTTGDFTMSFFAQYYRLNSAIGAGSVNGAAIFTMSYQ